jgi:hypothetical protein
MHRTTILLHGATSPSSQASRSSQGKAFHCCASAPLEQDSSPLEPKVFEYKLFARGVGLVRAFEVSGGSGHEELLSYSKGK